MSAATEQNRILELDVFRGIAAFAVLLFHYTTRNDLAARG
jgi:peptidoglycan/LPS O-acetylase OafA/YrhL